MKIWIANALATLLVTAAVILQLIDAAHPDERCGPYCDPHGYVLIFVGFPSVLGALLGLVTVGLLIARLRVGLILALVVAGGCGLELLLFNSMLPALRIVEVALLIVVSVVLAVLGLRTPRPVRERLPEPPYPAV